MTHEILAAALRSYAADLDASGPQYAGMAETLRRGAVCADACVWIAEQPVIGYASSWWALRDMARQALGLPNSQRHEDAPTSVPPSP